MADKSRIVEIFIDVDNALLVDVDGNEVRDTFTLYRRTDTIIRATIRQSAPALTPLEPTAGSVWFFAFDNSFDPTHTDLTFTLDAAFNSSGDWSDVDADNGKVVWPVNTATTALTTAIGTDETLEGFSELWYTAPGAARSTLVAQWATIIRGIVSEIDSDTTLESVSNNIIAFDGDDTVIYYPDGSIALRLSK